MNENEKESLHSIEIETTTATFTMSRVRQLAQNHPQVDFSGRHENQHLSSPTHKVGSVTTKWMICFTDHTRIEIYILAHH